MTTVSMRQGVLGAIVAGVMSVSVASASSDSRMAEAHRLYDDAKYAEALATLDQLAAEQPTPGIHQYRALCLIAIGKGPEAERAMSEIVALDPFFALDDEAASPRVVTMFATVRRRLLPPMIRRGFAEATAFYREGARDRAHERFDEVLRLLDDPSLKSDQSLADLALVASAFVELTRAPQPIPATAPAAASVSAAPTVPVASPAVASAPAVPMVPAAGPVPASSAAIVASAAPFEPAVALVRPLPKWTPPDARAASQRYAGMITVTVDETGKVVGAATTRLIHPAYDPVVIEAARDWVYRPARQSGVPVRSEVNVDVELLPSTTASN
jgi:tetratricopeptide (TPR) repeat protein